MTQNRQQRVAEAVAEQRRLHRLGVISFTILTISLSGLSVIFHHLITDHFGYRPVEGIDYAILLLVGLATLTAAATALPPALMWLRHVCRSKRAHQDKPFLECPYAANASNPPDLPVDYNRQVVKLIRNAERLNDVEQELIRRISKYETDISTQRLIAEVQICTSRMMKQLADLSVEERRPVELELPEPADTIGAYQY